MALVTPSEGEVRIQQVLFGQAAAENFLIKLYTNDYTPVQTSTSTDFTEASGNGYSAQSIDGADFTIVSGSPSMSTGTQQTFSFTGALGNVYGYYVVGATSGVVYWAERFSAAPVNVQYNGSIIYITPVYGLN